jgi:hypothetical protein
MRGFYQKFQTLNDVNGNPRRLLFIYDEQAELFQVVYAQSTYIDTEHLLYQEGYKSLVSVDVSRSEFNRLLRMAKAWKGGILSVE